MQHAGQEVTATHDRWGHVPKHPEQDGEPTQYGGRRGPAGARTPPS